MASSSPRRLDDRARVHSPRWLASGWAVEAWQAHAALQLGKASKHVVRNPAETDVKELRH